MRTTKGLEFKHLDLFASGRLQPDFGGANRTGRGAQARWLKQLLNNQLVACVANVSRSKNDAILIVQSEDGGT